MKSEPAQKWEKLCKWLLGKASDHFANSVIKLVIGLCVEENDLLGEVNENVKKLISFHLQAGKDYLEDASHATVKKREELIADARREFTIASNVDSPFEAAKACMLVGACYAILKENKNALRWYEKGYTKGHTYAFELDRKINAETSTFETIATWTAALALTISVIGLPYLFYQMSKSEKEHNQIVDQIEEIYVFLRPLSDLLYAHKSRLKILRPSDDLIAPEKMLPSGDDFSPPLYY